METPTVLAYGFDGPAAKKLRGVCGKLGLRLRKILPEEHAQPVGAFAGRGKFSDTPETAGAVPGEMLVLCHVSERQLEGFLSGLRTARVGTAAVKAVLTDTNARWTGAQLYAELVKERAELEEKGSEHHE